MIQKTAVHRSDHPSENVNFDDVMTIANSIVIETMALYLSGELDKLEELRAGGNENEETNHSRMC